MKELQFKHVKNMNDKEYFSTLNYEKSGTISVQPSPKDILDVKPEILANMKARFKGESLSDIYDISDRKVDELSIARERIKLRKVFDSQSQLREAFSSIKNIKLIKEEIIFEEVNKTLLSKYALIKSNEQPMDEVDVYNSLLFGSRWVMKDERAKRYNDLKKRRVSDNAFTSLLEWYRLTHFEILKITKEIIQTDDRLLRLFRDRRLASLFDELLDSFYGWAM